MTRDFDAAEDALQDAFAIAATRWPSDGIPANPGGWIMTTAKRRVLDQMRRSKLGELKEQRAITEAYAERPDDRLTLIFTCCHPALSLDNRVALTLRTICGLTTEEIASAFLVSTETMAKRLVRAKNKIKVARISYEVPDPEHWEPRLNSVLATIYLAFNRGYDLGPRDARGSVLCAESIDLARLLDLLVPNEPEIEGLLALMLFTHARAAARLDDSGAMILLGDQDTNLWDHQLLAKARRLVAIAPQHGSVGQYWIQAAIAAEHTAMGPPTKKNWRAIVELYDKLLDQTGRSPVVQLNRALAVAELSGPATALDLLDGLDKPLQDYPLLPAARADLYRRSNQLERARAEYRRAIELSPLGTHRDSLLRALKEIS